MKNRDLNKTKEELLAAIGEAGLTIFPGAYPSEETPEIPWESEVDSDPYRIVQVAKSLGVKLLCVSWNYFSQQELNDELIEQDGQGDLASIAYNQTLLVFKQFVGQLGSIRAGFFHEGAFYVIDIDAEWYRDFETLAMLGDPLDRQEDELEDDEIELAEEWAEAQEFDSTLAALKKHAGKKTHRRKIAGARDYKPRPGDVVLDADPRPALPHEKPVKGIKKHTH